MQYRPEIDGLRALAVLPVVLYHAGFSWMVGGYIGVDIFFVISGYLITSIIINEINKDKFSLVNFYERRARRILPALFFMLIISIPFGWLLLPPDSFNSYGQGLVSVAVFASNIFFWLTSGYFETASEFKPLIHTWSLAVEEQYYIFYPLILLGLFKFGLKKIVTVLIIIFALSLGFAQWQSEMNPNLNFFMIFSRAWELLLGCFVAIYLNNFSYIPSRITNNFLSILGFALIGFSLLTFTDATPFPSFYALIPTIGTSLLILSAIKGTLIHKILSIKPIVFMGLISYSTYLWHQPILAFARGFYMNDIPLFLVIIICISSFFIGFISWKFIEAPFRDRSIIQRKTIFKYTFFGIILFSVIGLIIDKKDGFPARSQFSDELLSSFERPDLSGCFGLNLNHNADSWGCYLGDEKPSIDFILFGDSHAGSYRNIIDEIGKNMGLKIFFTGSSGCPPILDVFPQRLDQDRNNCFLLNKRVLRLAKSENIRGVIFAARWSYYTYGDYSNRGIQYISNSKLGPFNLEESISTFKSGLAKTIESYTNLGIPIYIISQPPQLYGPPENIYFLINSNLIKKNELSTLRKDFEDMEFIPHNEFKKYEDRIIYYRLVDNFCNKQICFMGEDDASYYFDDDHLSIYGANKTKQIFKKILN